MITSTTARTWPRAAPILHSSGIEDPDWDGDAADALRAREYARLDALDQTYLDYTGGGLYAESQVREHQELLRTGIFGNPHSNSPASRVVEVGLVQRIQARVLARPQRIHRVAVPIVVLDARRGRDRGSAGQGASRR